MTSLSIVEHAGKKFLVYHVGSHAKVFEVADNPNNLNIHELVGKTVTKGPDWKWRDQGGKNPKGLVLEVHPTETGWVSVIWDNGDRNAYRWGAEDSYDLSIVEDKPIKWYNKFLWWRK